MSKSPECDRFEGRLRTICRGEAGLPLEGENSTNEYRRSWGLKPLGGNTTAVSQHSPEPPSVIIRGWNFASAIARWTLAGMPRRSQAEIDERLAICQACPFLKNNHCTKCGCACVEQNRLINKLALATEKCPEGKWT